MILMRILIYGAGVIGSLYAALFAEAGYDTSIYARGKRLEALRNNGLLYKKNQEVIKAESFLPVIGLALLWVMGYVMPMSIVMIGVCSCIVNAGIGFMLVFITVLLSEVVDYGEYKLGTRNESILFSMQTFVVKFGGAFSGFLSGIGLSEIGFVANQQQSTGTMTGMKIIMILFPAIMMAFCYVVYIKGYKLDGETYKMIRDELRKRKEQ